MSLTEHEAAATLHLEMVKRLDVNRWKTGWANLSFRECLRRMESEVGELRKALRQEKPPAEILAEAADVANFAAFLASNYADTWAEERVS